MDYRYIASTLLREHPQTMAVALARMPEKHAAEVIRLLPGIKQAEVLERISSLGEVPEELLEPIDALLSSLLR